MITVSRLRTLWLLLLPCLLAACAHALQGTCTAVADGDTISVRDHAAAQTVKVRLNGIDAPETAQEYGQESKRYLASRILGKTVRVEGGNRDKYGRLLGTVYLGAENMNLTMVRQGWAWDYTKYCAGLEYTAAQRQARTARRGLWRQQDPLPPWIFRHPDQAPASASSSAAAAAHRTDAGDYMYWISNNGKTHNRSCRWFLGNSGTGRYTNTPGAVDAKCCGGAHR